jgi:hypothetical protein
MPCEFVPLRRSATRYGSIIEVMTRDAVITEFPQEIFAGTLEAYPEETFQTYLQESK